MIQSCALNYTVCYTYSCLSGLKDELMLVVKGQGHCEFTSVPFLWTKCLTTALREFLHSAWNQYGLVRIWVWTQTQSGIWLVGLIFKRIGSKAVVVEYSQRFAIKLSYKIFSTNEIRFFPYLLTGYILVMPAPWTIWELWHATQRRLSATTGKHWTSTLSITELFSIWEISSSKMHTHTLKCLFWQTYGDSTNFWTHTTKAWPSLCEIWQALKRLNTETC